MDLHVRSRNLMQLHPRVSSESVQGFVSPGMGSKFAHSHYAGYWLFTTACTSRDKEEKVELCTKGCGSVGFRPVAELAVGLSPKRCDIIVGYLLVITTLFSFILSAHSVHPTDVPLFRVHSTVKQQIVKDCYETAARLPSSTYSVFMTSSPKFLHKGKASRNSSTAVVPKCSSRNVTYLSYVCNIQIDT